MEKAVDVAEKNMARFGLSQAEISSRRKWVMQTRRQVRAPGKGVHVRQCQCWARLGGPNCRWDCSILVMCKLPFFTMDTGPHVHAVWRTGPGTSRILRWEARHRTIKRDICMHAVRGDHGVAGAPGGACEGGRRRCQERQRQRGGAAGQRGGRRERQLHRKRGRPPAAAHQVPASASPLCLSAPCLQHVHAIRPMSRSPTPSPHPTLRDTMLRVSLWPKGVCGAIDVSGQVMTESPGRCRRIGCIDGQKAPPARGAAQLYV